MADSQPPEGLRKIACLAARDWARTHFHQQPDDRMVDAVLAALFGACEVRDGDDPYSAGFFAGYSRGSEDRINEIHKAGRLLPSRGEVRTEWSVVFKDGFRAKTFQRSMARAYRTWLDDPSIATVGPVEERTVTTWPDGSKLTGPWSPVLSDNSEVPNVS